MPKQSNFNHLCWATGFRSALAGHIWISLKRGRNHTVSANIRANAGSVSAQALSATICEPFAIDHAIGTFDPINYTIPAYRNRRAIIRRGLNANVAQHFRRRFAISRRAFDIRIAYASGEHHKRKSARDANECDDIHMWLSLGPRKQKTHALTSSCAPMLTLTERQNVCQRSPAPRNGY